MKYSRKDLDIMLSQAYKDARKNERNTRAALEFEVNLEENLRDLREELYRKQYTVSPAICFMISYPTKREVFAPSFRDRVISHFVYNILVPNIDKKFIFDSYSCRVEKGTLFGIKRFHKMLRSSTNNFTIKKFVLSLDISGYFMNINKNILEETILELTDLEKHKFDYDMIKYLVHLIVQSDATHNCIRVGDSKDWLGLPAHKSLFNTPTHKGLPIGALTSLLFSNVYLNKLDLYVKHSLKCKYYCRYVDDVRIIGDKEELEKIAVNILKFLKDSLDLELNMLKTTIISTYKRHSFLGAIIQNNKIYASPRTLINFAKTVHDLDYFEDNIISKLNSYLGYLLYFCADKTTKAIINNSFLKHIFIFTKNKAKIIMIKTGTWGWEPPMYERYQDGKYRILFDPQLEEVETLNIDHETNEEQKETILQYKVKFVDLDLPKLTTALKNKDKVAASKILLEERIKAYDSSDAVNSFTFNGYPIWLDKATRVGLVNSITTEKKAGFLESTLWFGDISFNIDCDAALYILEQLELYAIKCYNKTAEHLRDAAHLTTVEELDNYNYREGYPAKLNFLNE